MTKHISCVETAKLIRKALKDNFAGIKFSVRIRPGTVSIHVEWTNGPTSATVDKIVKQFEGASFDGMYDLKTYKDGMLNGEEAHFGTDYVMTHRKTTRAFVEAIIAAYGKHWNCDTSKIEIRGTEQEARPDAWKLGISEDHWFNEIFEATDAKDMHRPYEAKAEREEAAREEWTRNEPQRKAEEKARQEKEATERARVDEARRQRGQAQAKARQEQEERRQQATRQKREIFYTREQALAYLGLSVHSSETMIKTIFKMRVRNASDGKGGYTEDMDKLVKAKEKALQR